MIAYTSLQKDLASALKLEGYEPEQRRYTPHITLGRQVIIPKPLNEFMLQPISVPVKSFALMESKRVGEQLVYEVIEEVDFID